jgi:hypothetical protein
MFASALRRLFQRIPAVLAISLAMCLLPNALPGNAPRMPAGVQASGLETTSAEPIMRMVTRG